VTIETLP
jgi:hypothetical protein